MDRVGKGNLPKDAVWKVVVPWAKFLPPVMTVLPFPSPTNITLVFFLPTFKFSSSYLTILHHPKNIDFSSMTMPSHHKKLKIIQTTIFYVIKNINSHTINTYHKCVPKHYMCHFNFKTKGEHYHGVVEKH